MIVNLLSVLFLIAMTSFGGVLGAAEAPSDEEQIRGLIPRATAIDREVWEKITRASQTPTMESFNDRSLSAELFLLDDKTAENSNGTFRFLGERLRRPDKLVKEMSPGIDDGRSRVDAKPITMIHAERITSFLVTIDGDKATGSLKFRVPELYEGQANFVATRNSSKWQIIEMSMPKVGIHIARDATGRWRRVEAQEELKVTKGPHIIASSVWPDDRTPVNNPRYGLTRNDVKAIVAMVPTVQLVVPVREVRRVARFGDQTSEVQLVGTVPEYSQLHRLRIEHGRYLVPNDIKQLQSVAVIGSRVAEDLFLFENPVGKKIRIGEHYFVVAGVLAKRSHTDDTKDIWIPLTTMRSRLGDRDISRQAGELVVRNFELSRIEIRVQSFPDIPRSAQVVERVLDHLHNPNDFAVKDLFTELKRKSQ